MAQFCRDQPLPGKLQPKGRFEHADPANEEALEERKRDFSRIAMTQRDIWIFTTSCRRPGVTFPIKQMNESLNGGGVIQSCFEQLRFWLRSELVNINGAADLELTSRWYLSDRVISSISVTPCFNFAMFYQVPPMFLQVKYILAISRSGQVRVIWYAFITNNPLPGATSGPWVVRLVSEDLNIERDRTHIIFWYTVKANRETAMENVVAGQIPQLLGGIDEDAWDAFLHA